MTVKLTLLEAGHCTHPEFILRKGGSFTKQLRFPASVALIEHPKYGKILFDTGYSMKFYEATRSLPEKVYAWVTPVYVTVKDTAAFQLQQRGISPEDIDYVILSHFHADHIAGMSDFPKAKYIFLDEAYRNVASLSRISRVKAGFLKDLLPADFTQRARSFELSTASKATPPLPLFPLNFDLFGDMSIVGIPLPGHAPGHMGLYVESENGPVFFVADACWLEEQFSRLTKVNPLSYLIMENKAAYLATIQKLHMLNEQDAALQVIPCHCSKSIERYQGAAG